MDLNNAMMIVEEYNHLLRTQYQKAMDPVVLDRALGAAALIMSLFRLIPAQESQSVFYSKHPHVGHTLNQYYNDTVAFLLDSKKRLSGHEFYRDLFETYVHSYSKTKDFDGGTSLGGKMLSAMLGIKGRMVNYGTTHQTIDVDCRLLSYADHELLSLWVTRKGGFIDLFDTLSNFIKLSRP